MDSVRAAGVCSFFGFVLFDNKYRGRTIQWFTGEVISLKVLYIDTLIFVNLIVNYFLLLITAFFTKSVKKRWRIAMAAGVGAVLSLVVLLPEFPWVLAASIKVLGAFAMAATAFGVKNTRFLLKNASYLFLSSSLLAGIIIALEESGSAHFFYTQNFGIYLDLSPLLLIIIALASYLLLCLFDLLFRNPHKMVRSCAATMVFDVKKHKLNLMVDTGHHLQDPLSGRDVLVLKKTLAPRILNEIQQNALACGTTASGSLLSKIGDFALVSFTSLGGPGMLIGFGAQYCEIQREKKKNIRIERPYVAFSEEQLPFEIDGLISGDTLDSE